MASISRGSKTGGGTGFNTGQAMKSAEFNTDFDTIYTDYNGNITNANISASAAIDGSKLNLTSTITSAMIVDGTIVNADVNAAAAIAPTKLDDYSSTVTEMATATDPGVSNSESQPTTVAGELERLRYALERIGLGIDAGRFDATGTIESTYWGDVPVRGIQRIPGINGVVTSGLPSGWTNVNTATLAQEAADAADKTAGKGRAIKITAAGSANEGMSYTLSGLKASTKYWFAANMKATSGDTAKFQVTGADATSAFRDATNTTTATAWTWLPVVVQTDSTPTNLVIKTLAAADTDIVWVADVLYGECSATPLGSPRVAVIEYLASSTAGTQTIDGGSDAGLDAGYRFWEAGTTDFDVTVYVPGDGYYIEVEAQFCGIETAANNSYFLMTARLYESVGGAALAAAVTIPIGRAGPDSSNAAGAFFGTAKYIVKAPTPGSSYRYAMAATAATAVTPQKGGLYTSSLSVKVLPYGG